MKVKTKLLILISLLSIVLIGCSGNNSKKEIKDYILDDSVFGFNADQLKDYHKNDRLISDNSYKQDEKNFFTKEYEVENSLNVIYEINDDNILSKVEYKITLDGINNDEINNKYIQYMEVLWKNYGSNEKFNENQDSYNYKKDNLRISAWLSLASKDKIPNITVIKSKKENQ